MSAEPTRNDRHGHSQPSRHEYELLRIAVAREKSLRGLSEQALNIERSKVARVKAMHVRSYPTASDEVYGTNVECSCGDRWPCDTRAALDADA